MITEIVLVAAFWAIAVLTRRADINKLNIASEQNLPDAYGSSLKTYVKGGVILPTARAQFLNLTKYNDVYDPWSAPNAESTWEPVEVLKNLAKDSAKLMTEAPNWLFRKKIGEQPVATAEQATPIVDIPHAGFMMPGDPNGSLTKYPLAFINRKKSPSKAATFMGFPMGNAGMGETIETARLPNVNRLKAESDPWGPGGKYLNLFGSKQALETIQKGYRITTSIIQPPQ